MVYLKADIIILSGCDRLLLLCQPNDRAGEDGLYGVVNCMYGDT